MSQATIIYIGASQLQLPAIAWAKQQGLKVVVTDSNPNAPGITLADECRQLNGADVEGLMKLAHEISDQDTLVGCYCGSDFGLSAVAAIAKMFNLPAASEEATRFSLDKAKATSVLKSADINVPTGECVELYSELGTAVERIGLPVIIKPVNSSGSRGVRTVIHRDQLSEAFSEAQQFSSKILVEQVIEGEHIDVNGLFIDNVFYPCGLLDRYFSPQPFNYPVWGCQPCSLTEKNRKRVYESVEAGARALGIHDGPVKADVIVSNNVPVILEISPRFHGDVSTSFVTPLVANGHGAPQAWFAYLAGKPYTSFLPCRHEDGDIVAGWMAIFPDTAGVFETIDGIEDAIAIEGVEYISTLKQPGYRIKAVADNLAVMGFIWATAGSSAVLKENLDRARNLLHVRMGR